MHKKDLQKTSRTIFDLFFANRVFRPLLINPGIINPWAWKNFYKYKNYNIPFRQAVSFVNLINFSSILNANNIQHYLGEGTLLGAVRQGSFAGRPSDIDIIITYEDLHQFLNITHNLINNMYRIRLVKDKSVIRCKPLLGCPINVSYYTLISEENNVKIYKRIISKSHKINKLEKFIYADDLLYHKTAYIFDHAFNIPRNAEKYLAQSYGPDWQVPDSPQLAWRK